MLATSDALWRERTDKRFIVFIFIYLNWIFSTLNFSACDAFLLAKLGSFLKWVDIYSNLQTVIYSFYISYIYSWYMSLYLHQYRGARGCAVSPKNSHCKTLRCIVEDRNGDTSTWVQVTIWSGNKLIYISNVEADFSTICFHSNQLINLHNTDGENMQMKNIKGIELYFAIKLAKKVHFFRSENTPCTF